MIVYIVPFFITILAAIKYDIGGHQDIKQKIIWYFLYGYLILLIGLRYKVGGDTLVYMEEYVWRKNLSEWTFSWQDYYEPFYTLLCALTKTISDDFVVFQIVHAILLNSCLFYFISKSTNYRFTALLFCFIYYYLYFSTEILRESLAILIFVLNYKNFEKKKWGKYYFGVLIAILFHISAVVLVAFPLFRGLKFNWKYLILLFFSIVLFANINSFFSLFTNADKIGYKLMLYEDNLLIKGGFLGTLLTIFSFCRFTVIPLFFYLWMKKILKLKPQYESMICLYTLLGIGVWFNSVIFERFPNYITPLFFISVANVLVDSLKKKASISRKMMGVVFFCLIIIVYGTFPARIYMRWIPYYSIFNPHSVVRIK